MNRVPLRAQDGKMVVRDLRAAALATLGYTLSPCAYQNAKSGADRLTWFVDDARLGRPGPAEAARLLAEAEQGVLPQQSPEHPFLASMAALHTLEQLRRWARAEPSLSMPAGGRLRVLRAGRAVDAGEFAGHDRGAAVPFFPHAVSHAEAVQTAAVCAAIVCGFPLWPELSASGSQPAAVLCPQSTGWPDLTLDVLSRAVDPASLLQPSLAGYAAGEHPLYYALQAILNLWAMEQTEAQARRDPVMEFRGRATAGAMISASLLAEGRKDSAALRDQLRRHLLKVS